MNNTIFYAVSDQHILYPIRVHKHKPMTNIQRVWTTIDLHNDDLTGHIIDHHSESSISFTFKDNVNENHGIFDNKKDAMLFALSQINEELKAIKQREKELQEIKENNSNL